MAITWKLDAKRHFNKNGKCWSVEDHGFIDGVHQFIRRTSKGRFNRVTTTVYDLNDNVVSLPQQPGVTKMESKITHSKGGTMFAGPDAVAVFQAAALSSGIGLLQVGIKPRRGWTMTRALAEAARYTGVKYKRSEAEKARADLKVWIETMKSALPTEVKG